MFKIPPIFFSTGHCLGSFKEACAAYVDEESSEISVSNDSENSLLNTARDIIITDFSMDAEGRVYHLALKKGGLANDMIIVGNPTGRFH